MNKYVINYIFINIDKMSEIIINNKSKLVPETTSDTLIPLLVLIVIVVFLGWLFVLLLKSGFQVTNAGDPVSTDGRRGGTVSITCAPGQCATNIFSGFKTCPVENDVSLVINPVESVCNSRFVCDNPLTPFALQSDSSTSLFGQCEAGVECPCLKYSQCPQYILSAFTASNGNPYANIDGQRITFPQIASFTVNGGGQSDVPPIQYNNPTTTFCTVPLSWLSFSTPGCNFISLAGGATATFQDLLYCMGQINGCFDLGIGSPCLQGTLAFISDNPDNLTQNDINVTPMGCVPGTGCPCGEVAIYDTSFGGIVCRTL